MTPPLTCRGTASSALEIRRPLVDLGPFELGRVIQHHRLTLAHDLARQRAVHRHGFDGRQRLAQPVPDLQPGLIGQQQDCAARCPDQALGFGADDVQYLVENRLLEQAHQNAVEALALNQPPLQLAIQLGVLACQGCRR